MVYGSLWSLNATKKYKDQTKHSFKSISWRLAVTPTTFEISGTIVKLVRNVNVSCDKTTTCSAKEALATPFAKLGRRSWALFHSRF